MSAILSPPPVAKRPAMRDIARIVGNRLEVSMAEMRGASRARRITLARQIGQYLCRSLTEQSLPQIGMIFGDRDHTTVLHGVRSVEARILVDPVFGELVDSIRQAILATVEDGDTPPFDRAKALAQRIADEGVANASYSDMLNLASMFLKHAAPEPSDAPKAVEVVPVAPPAPPSPVLDLVRPVIAAHERLQSDLYTSAEAAARDNVISAVGRLAKALP